MQWNEISLPFGKGLTINNLNKFVVRHFENQALSGLKPIPDPGRGQDSDKTVTNPSLKAGVSGYTSYRGFSPDGTATVVVHVIYCQPLRVVRFLLSLTIAAFIQLSPLLAPLPYPAVSFLTENASFQLLQNRIPRRSKNNLYISSCLQLLYRFLLTWRLPGNFSRIRNSVYSSNDLP